MLAWMVAILQLGQSAFAVDLTEVLDAADSDFYVDPLTGERHEVKDPVDFHLGISFQQTRERMKINREKCARGDTCPTDGGLYNKELRYDRTISQMNIDFEAGIYKDLEFHLKLPVILSDQRKYKYARNGEAACEFDINPDDPKCVNQTNSTVDPSDARVSADQADDGTDLDSFANGFGTYRFFDLPSDTDWSEGPDRGGLGDITIGLDWAIFNDDRYFRDVGPESPWYRNHGRSSLVVGFNYTMPSAAIAKADNTAVGQGVHWLNWRVAASRRYQYAEPYAQFSFTLPVAASNTLFKDYGGGQERVGPGVRGEITAGVEFIPWEVKPLSTEVRSEFAAPEYSGEHRKVAIDLRGMFGFVAEGREYGPMFDALNRTTCQGLTLNDVSGASPSRPECGWIGEKWSNAGFEQVGRLDPFRVGGTPGTAQDLAHPLNEDGITDYEGYAYVNANLGLTVQPTKWVSLRTRFGLAYQQDHFLTFAKAGKDTRGRSVPDDPSQPSVPGDEFGKDGTVSFDDIKERNPTYNPKYDGVGRRFRSAENTIFTWDIGLTFQF
jgi:hypothetical protein